MKKVIALLVLGLLLFSLVGVIDAKKESESSSSNSISGSSSSSGKTSEIEEESSTEEAKSSESEMEETEEITNKGPSKGTQTITLLDENKNQYQVTVRTETKNNGEESEIKIKVRGVEIDSELEVDSENNSLKAKLSNGNNKEIKIMPDTASQTAIDRLQTKGIEVQLKEVGEGNNLSVVYEIDGNKTVKFLGLFKVRTQVTAVISAENGEVLKLEKPWWYFLAFGKGTIDCNGSNLDLCDDSNECYESGLYWYNSTCNLNPEPICSSENLNLCSDENSCFVVNGTWNNETSVCV